MNSAQESIAVIGMACEFPGAHSPEELWQNVLAGRRYFRKAPPERLPSDYFDPNPEAPGKSYCDLMAVLDGWRFDPVEFRIPPVTFQTADMSHWLALSTARAAFRDARLSLENMDRSRIGVILGNSLTGEFSRSHNLRFRWPYVERSLQQALRRRGVGPEEARGLVADVREIYEAPLPAITEDTLAGNMANTIAGRVCNYFDLGAGGFTVDGACSSSLLSFALACDALNQGQMDVALAGGVDISLDPFEIVGFAKTRALATDDIRPYDARAAGMLTGEGCAILVLARESVARAAGYAIRALIRGWGYSSDGAGGMTAPSVEGQMRALRRAYAAAGYSVATVELIEGHGTGTSLGDKVELTALRRLREESPGLGACRIGSLKANIGHCKAAAGVAGLLKVILALERKILPPTLNCSRPNPAFGVPMIHLRPSTEGGPWASGPTPRRASVSAMGFGGANAHLTLEESNPGSAPSSEDLSLLGGSQTSELIVLGAATWEELQDRITALLPLARRICRAELTDLSAALTKSVLPARFRLAFLTHSPWNLAESLSECATQLAAGANISELDDPATGIFAGSPLLAPKLVALFPGQGSQRLNMGAAWRQRFPFVRHLHEAVTQLGDELPVLGALGHHIFRDRFAPADTQRNWEMELRQTQFAQPALVLTSMAMSQVLRFFGLNPAYVLGHSLGEISAFAVAGAWDPLAAVRLAALRGEAMTSHSATDSGSMAAVTASASQVQHLIEPFHGALVISNYNSPRQTVVAGPVDSVQQFSRLCAERKLPCRPLAVSHAFHSTLVAPAATAFRAAACRRCHAWALAPPGATEHSILRPSTALPGVISSVTGQPVSSNGNVVDYLADQIRQPVRFMDAVLKAAEVRPALWIEVGPGSVLTGLVRDILNPVQVHCLPTDLPDEDGFHLLGQVLARAWVLGFPVRLDRLFAHRFHRSLDLEHYEPQFIVNPCERPVARAKAESSPSLPAAHAPGPPPEILSEREALLAFALEWIARRTGYPTTALQSEHRLRDDLNLDSIKAGELVVLLAQRSHRRFEADPSSVANARIRDLIEAVLDNSHAPRAEAASEAARSRSREPVASLAEWTRTFKMVRAPAPLPEGALGPLPEGGICVIVAETFSAQTQAIAARLKGVGIEVAFRSVESLRDASAPPQNLTTLILLLPETRLPFWACSPAEFDQRVEGTATALFRVFRWAGHGREDRQLRGLILRPVSGDNDPGADLDGGVGFLKSLGLEYPTVQSKWLALPGDWPPERWAETVVQELPANRAQVGFVYTRDGQRWCEVAKPSTDFPSVNPRLNDPAIQAFSLGPADVVLVTGGAKGITCELALALAQQTGAKFALLGSSPLPEASGNHPDDEVLRNLHRFEEMCVEHLYLQADVTDWTAVRQAVERVERAWGPVTGILHGAGSTALRLFRDKDLGEFLKCIRIKARGLYNLLGAIPAARLKMLHVVSSVLGKTGMRGQADYALANAWLARAVRVVKAVHPHLHCLSLGYTAWEETGLARRVGALDSLRALGVVALSTQEGVAAYLDLLQRSLTDTDFIITRRLTQDLEATLYARPTPLRGRFLQQVHRCVPGVECVADATLSHATDLYLPEHVFEGTPMFPSVMAIEAMAEAALACLGGQRFPILRRACFHTPLLVPEGTQVVFRTLALADVPSSDGVRVRVAIRSERDGFQRSHFEAEWWVDGENSAPPQFARVLPQPLPARLSLDPEDFSPVPLFQGRFFRRITSIRQLQPGKESLTEIQVPVAERYFQGVPDPTLVTSSPAVRDACLQSGALILPPGCLPSQFEEVRLCGGFAAPATILCHTWVRSQSAEEFVVDLAAYAVGGPLLETVEGLHLQRTGAAVAPQPAPSPVSLARVPSDLRALLPQTPHALVLIAHTDLVKAAPLEEVSSGEREQLETETPLPRQLSALGDLVAARRAACAYARREIAHEVTLTRRADGKPELRFADESLAQAFAGTDLSLADGCGVSLTWIGPAPAGADLEVVETRDTELWRGLLGDDGYALALRVARQTAESFDTAATRVWTLLEAGRKANALHRLLPVHECPLGGTWLCFLGNLEGVELEFLSGLMMLPLGEVDPPLRPRTAALSVVARRRTTESTRLGERVSLEGGSELAAVIAAFQRDMRRLLAACARDPQAPGSEVRHKAFLSVIARTSRQLGQVEQTLSAADLPAARRQFQEAEFEFLEGSENFRHTLAKPLGYAGDFQLLEMLVRNACRSHGLAFHFDQSQLEYPASQACRHRIEWVAAELSATVPRQAQTGLVILDLGIGAAPIEQRWISQHPDLPLRVHAVDLEPAALDYVVRVLAGGPRVVCPWRLNLRDPAVLAQVGEVAAQADACIAVGILEALTDLEAVSLLQTLLRALPSGAVLYAENFVPTHPTRSIMEWFLDFHLSYRSLEQLNSVALRAGADPGRMEMRLDSTGSLALLKLAL